MPKDQAYLLAEKKIEEALRSGATKLSLSRLPNEKLTEIPEALRQLTKLKTLDLYDNKLTKLPDWIEQLTQLDVLNVTKNLLTTLPESLGNLSQLQTLHLNDNKIITLPESISGLKQLQRLFITTNQLKTLPKSFNQLVNLTLLHLSFNDFQELPESVSQLVNLSELTLANNRLVILPEAMSNLSNLKKLDLAYNKLVDFPASFFQHDFAEIKLDHNPLNLELAAAYDQGYRTFKAYLRVKATGQIILDEAKLILVGEGEVGKTCLLDALQDLPWQEHKTTHGIEIRQVKVFDTKKDDFLSANRWNFKGKEITLNGWDFGGQRIYRPTHQLFFSAPAVYLVVWKPREGSQQGLVKEWIQLIKRREPSAKIIVVATHGGPQQRQPDIDRQELWELFGRDTIIDFLHVDSMPTPIFVKKSRASKYEDDEINGFEDEENDSEVEDDEEYEYQIYLSEMAQNSDIRSLADYPKDKLKRRGIEELKAVIARVAATLPEVGRSVPKSFADVRTALQATGVPYLSLSEVLAICRVHHMDDEIARLFITISHRLGHLTHYENDPALRDIVILRPDWLATAMSYVLDDEETRKAHGLVNFARLGQLWDDPKRPADTRYPDSLHRIFLRLMERFDLSYRVAGLSKDENANPVSLIAQLVPDTTPKAEDFNKAWTPELAPGDIQQTQICRIVDAGNGQSATAEGLFYQLIVRLHRYSLGRVHYPESVHWQRGLVLDADYNGRALLRHIGNDVHITVRAAYPQGFLNTLTDEVKYLVESFWEGLRCDVTVPCLATPDCKGLFEVSKLIENKKRGRAEVPCTICNEWQMVDSLLLNVPAAQPVPAGELLATQQVLSQLSDLRRILIKQHAVEIGRFDSLDAGQKELLSKAETSYNNLIKIFIDEAKEGPRLFSLVPVNRSGFNPEEWTSARFKLILWCEHSRWPLPVLNVKDSDKGVYEFEFTREWFKKVAPVLRTITSTLSIVLPIASSAVKLVMDETAYKAIENELDFGKEVINGVLSGTEKTEAFVDAGDSVDLPHGISIRAENAALRELHTLLKAKDPGFGGLVRVLNKRNEFLWVHERFAGEY
jgi:internalin A